MNATETITADGAPAADIVLRLGLPMDLPFIFQSWLLNYRQSLYVRHIPKPVYFTHHHRLATRLAQRATVLVAHPVGDVETILGYLVTERPKDAPPLLHYVYVKLPFRRLGIARRLIEAAHLEACHLTHWTDDARHLKAMLPRSEFNPYAAQE